MSTCKWPDGLDFRPDGIHSLCPCNYVVDQIVKNATIEILKCRKCGHCSPSWTMQSDSIDITDTEEAKPETSRIHKVLTMPTDTNKCSMPYGIDYRPDGFHSLDPCEYEMYQRYRNVTVEILRCTKCNDYKVTWFKQDNTEDITDESEDLLYF